MISNGSFWRPYSRRSLVSFSTKEPPTSHLYAEPTHPSQTLAARRSAGIISSSRLPRLLKSSPGSSYSHFQQRARGLYIHRVGEPQPGSSRPPSHRSEPTCPATPCP